jgi:hypothetical protein
MAYDHDRRADESSFFVGLAGLFLSKAECHSENYAGSDSKNSNAGGNGAGGQSSNEYGGLVGLYHLQVAPKIGHVLWGFQAEGTPILKLNVKVSSLKAWLPLSKGK